MRTLIDEILTENKVRFHPRYSYELEAGAFEFETSTSEVIRTSDQARSLQQNLNNLLSLQLATDGDLGAVSSKSESRKAIRMFQDLSGLTQTGLVDANTLNRLNSAVQTNPPDDLFRFYIFKNFELEQSTIRLLEHMDELADLKKYAHERIRNGLVNTICFMGHTDKSGSERYNERLSVNRASEIIRHLHTAWRCDDRIRITLLPPDPRQLRIGYYGLGEKHPLPRGTHAENRRVEVVLLKLDR